ncbi:S8 family serine peptidase [Rummeliibacillus pycnus]|uniref:S8 family serine peptidase n=1 Tax=Rummeliibacillus pycnus TaxID=101070 RepID=UPI0037CB08EF
MKNSWGLRKSAIAGLISLLTVSSLPFNANFAKAEESNVLDEFSKMKEATEKISEATKDFKDSDKVRVIVELKGEPAITYSTKQGVRFKDLKESKKDELISKVEKQQDEFISDVKDEDISFKVENQFTTVVNGVSGEVKYGDIEDLEKLDNVKDVSIVNEYERPTEKPEMLSSKELVEAMQTWNAGYDGEGMVVGVIDTGIDDTHKDMVLDKNKKIKLSKDKVGTLVKDANLSGRFYSDKVPYGYNYADKNSEILDLGPDASMHGMHVAGTVGANGDETDGKGIKGVAPNAQLLALKVFGNDQAMPSTFGDIYIKAIDDGIILGADVMNMSLGSTAGFVDSTSLEQQAIDRAVNNGVLMSISAGNSAQYGANYGNPLATNPDIGLVGSPGLSTNSLSVASIENSKITLDQLNMKIGNETLPVAYKTQSSPLPLEVFGKDTEKDVVYVGDGSPAEYKDKNVKGKVVFAVRNASNPNYTEIQKQAEAAGAAGVIIKGTAAHGDYVSMALTNPTIPLVSLGVSDGTMLETKIKAAGGVGKVNFTGKMTTVVNGSAGKISSFSSWGVTPSLEMKPEITAPGGQIYSTLNDDKYGVMSGTSMAAPHVSGGSALVLEKVQEAFPNLTGADKVKRAKTLLMNTAKIVTDSTNNNLPYSPRQQGAGLMQLNAAVTTPVYVEAEGTHEGKIELKEIKDDMFYMTVKATNFGKENVSYKVDASVLTDATSGSETAAVNALKEQIVKDAKITIDKKNITIFPGKTQDITVQVDLSKAKAALEAIQKNGYFVEGFITLTNDSQDVAYPNLSVPYLGFKGDWNKPPVLDATKYDTGSYYNVSGMVDDEGYYLGYNPFKKTYSKDKIAISPNGDGLNETVTPVLSFLRNSKTVEYAITDASGKVLRKLRTDKEQRKTYHNGKSNGSIYSYKPFYTEWDGYLNNKKAADGTYYYQVKTQVDLAGKDNQVTKFPIIVDNTAPVVSSIAYSKKTGILSFNATDEKGSGLQFIEVYANGKLLGNLQPSTQSNYRVNVGKLADKTSIQVIAYDYAYNHGGLTTSSPGDTTIPYIVSDTPEALGVYDTRDIPVTGYVTDGSEVDYLKIKGDKLTNKTNDVKLVYNPVTKQYDFATMIKFTEDGVHDIYFEGADKVGNKIEFRRQIIIDTEGPTLSVSGLPDNNFVAMESSEVKEPEKDDDATKDNEVVVNDDSIQDAESAEKIDTTVKSKSEVVGNEESAPITQVADPVESKKSTDPEVTVTVSDNFDDLRLLVNGSEEYTTDFKEPYVMRKTTHEQKVQLNLEKGINEVVFQVTDLAGHITKKTINIYKDVQEPNPFVTSLEISNESNVTVDNPAVITASASKSIDWEAKVVGPSGKVTNLEGDKGTTYEGTFTPDKLAESGKYQLIIGAKDSDDSEKQISYFNVSNYPVTVDTEKTLVTDELGNVESSFAKDRVVSIRTIVKNLGAATLNTKAVFQVKDKDGAVVYFQENNASDVIGKAKNRFKLDIPLDSFESGEYTVELFVLDTNDQPIPLAESSKIATFTVK